MKLENENSVCFISKINKLESIKDADKIELATINGWTSVVQKGIHKEGDLILCITTDAVIPQELANKWGVDKYLGSKNRVRTVKLKGVYSECILIPWESKDLKNPQYKEGEDLQQELEIFKYEIPVNTHVSTGNRVKRPRYHQNPNFHIYYKFPNQKNTPNMFNEEDDVIITRKIHGTNARYGIVKKAKLSLLDRIKKFFGNKHIEYEFVYGSHNVEKGSDSQGFYSTDVWKEIADKYDIKNKLWTRFKRLDKPVNYVIYGEIYGEGIQGEKYNYGLKTKELALFDIQMDGEYLEHCMFYPEAINLLNLPIVQDLHYGKWSKEIQDKWVINQFIEGTKTPHEGIVVKCISGNRRKISKVINPDYKIFNEKNNIEDAGH